MLILWWHVLRVLYVFCRSQVVCRRTLQCTIKDLVSTVSVDFKVDHLIPLPTEGFSREKYLVESDQSLKQNQFVCTFPTDLKKISVTQKIILTNEKKICIFLSHTTISICQTLLNVLYYLSMLQGHFTCGIGVPIFKYFADFIS